MINCKLIEVKFTKLAGEPCYVIGLVGSDNKIHKIVLTTDEAASIQTRADCGRWLISQRRDLVFDRFEAFDLLWREIQLFSDAVEFLAEVD